VCQYVCSEFNTCGFPVEDCQFGCSQDLFDCSTAEVDVILDCTASVAKQCDLNAWISCIEKVGCIDR